MGDQYQERILKEVSSSNDIQWLRRLTRHGINGKDLAYAPLERWASEVLYNELPIDDQQVFLFLAADFLTASSDPAVVSTEQLEVLFADAPNMPSDLVFQYALRQESLSERLVNSIVKKSRSIIIEGTSEYALVAYACMTLGKLLRDYSENDAVSAVRQDHTVLDAIKRELISGIDANDLSSMFVTALGRYHSLPNFLTYSDALHRSSFDSRRRKAVMFGTENAQWKVPEDPKAHLLVELIDLIENLGAATKLKPELETVMERCSADDRLFCESVVSLQAKGISPNFPISIDWPSASEQSIITIILSEHAPFEDSYRSPKELKQLQDNSRIRAIIYFQTRALLNE